MVDWFEMIINNEGFISNDEYGGLTIFGIAEKFNKNEKIFKAYRENKSREELLKLAREFYYNKYYYPLRDIIKADYRVGYYTLDTGVNIGLGSALELLNRACGLRGNNITDKLLNTIRYNPRLVLYKLHAERVQYYNNITISDRNALKYLNGWLNRSYRTLKLLDRQ